MGYLYDKTYRKLLEKYKKQYIEIALWAKTIGLILSFVLILMKQYNKQFIENK